MIKYIFLFSLNHFLFNQKYLIISQINIIFFPMFLIMTILNIINNDINNDNLIILIIYYKPFSIAFLTVYSGSKIPPF